MKEVQEANSGKRCMNSSADKRNQIISYRIRCKCLMMICLNIQNREVNAIENWVLGSVYWELGCWISDTGCCSFWILDCGFWIHLTRRRNDLFVFPASGLRFPIPNIPNPTSHPVSSIEDLVSYIQYHLSSTILFTS